MESKFAGKLSTAGVDLALGYLGDWNSKTLLYTSVCERRPPC